MSDASDKRLHARHALELPITLSDADNRVMAVIQLDTADLSAGGAFVRSNLLFEIGETLGLQFSLPDGRSLRAKGLVVRVARDTGDDTVPGMGIRFVDLSDADKATLAALLAQANE